MTRIMNFDIDSVSDKTLKSIRKYTMMSQFTFEEARMRSAACA